jgi:hypothetical protein
MTQTELLLHHCQVNTECMDFKDIVVPYNLNKIDSPLYQDALV